MLKRMTALLGAILVLTAGAPQDDPKSDKEKAKQEARDKEKAARKALEEYRAAFGKAKNSREMNRALQDKLARAEPHPLISAELIRLLGNHGLVEVRLEVSRILGNYKHDPDAARALIAAAKVEKNEELRLSCIGVFGKIALPRMAGDLTPWINHKNIVFAQESIQAAVAIYSVRMIRPLTELLRELEAIRDPKPGEGSPENPAGSSDERAEVLRKQKLRAPTLTAIRTLWNKVDPNLINNTSKDSVKNLQKHEAQLLKIQQEEDKVGRGDAPDGKKDGDE